MIWFHFTLFAFLATIAILFAPLIIKEFIRIIKITRESRKRSKQMQKEIENRLKELKDNDITNYTTKSLQGMLKELGGDNGI